MPKTNISPEHPARVAEEHFATQGYKVSPEMERQVVKSWSALSKIGILEAAEFTDGQIAIVKSIHDASFFAGVVKALNEGPTLN